jgi:hypothetical protein
MNVPVARMVRVVRAMRLREFIVAADVDRPVVDCWVLDLLVPDCRK